MGTSGHYSTRGFGRLAPEVKVLAVLLFIFAVVATRREAIWAFGVLAVVVILVARTARLGVVSLSRRLVIEIPFVISALFLPIIGRSPRINVAGISLSQPGLWAGWNIIAKGTLGVATAAVLTATTPVTELLRGLDRLRVPKLFTAIAGFMIRYADVLRAEADRMRVARLSRGDDPRTLFQAKALAAGSGALFVRSYERGERVHMAMESRGFTGVMPELDSSRAAGADWMRGLVLPLVGAIVAAASWVIA